VVAQSEIRGSGSIVGKPEVMMLSGLRDNFRNARHPQLGASHNGNCQLPTTGLPARFGSRWRLNLCGGPEGKWFSQRAEEQNGCKMSFRNQKQNFGAQFR